jgi:hypothetical protein
MNARAVTAADELRQFAARYTEASGLPIPLEYLASSRVVTFHDRRGGLCGGMALAPGNVMRWPRQIPPGAALSATLDLSSCAELNALWLDGRFRKTRGSAAFWLAVSREIGASPYRHITFGVDPRKTGLARLYRRAASGVLYEGPVVNAPLPTLRLFHSTPGRFRWLWLLYSVDLARRFLRLPAAG